MTIHTWVRWVAGYQQQAAQEIIDLLRKKGIDVQGFDAYLSRSSGVFLCNEISPEICEQIRDCSRHGLVRVLVGTRGDMPSAATWQLMAAGASDVLCWATCDQGINEIVYRLQRWETVDRLMASPAVRDVLIGASPAMTAILRQVVEVSHCTDASVLILGESGTGKELVANLIHALDSRPNKGKLVILDCSTIMPDLSGSEFFGHERGAFTGAVSGRDGAFALADGGTLFLDEVGELPLSLQSQLLRVIQEHTFKRVGGNAWQQTSFRLLCATNRDLWAQVQHGEFRADLYYRIASFVCPLPPLRERPEDILPLAYHFLKERYPHQSPPALDAPVQEYLLRRDYPGNVRDLKQVVARMLCRYTDTGAITVGCIAPDDRPTRTEDWSEWRDAGFEHALRLALKRGVGLKAISRGTEETAIRIAVDEQDGNLQRAALRLGVTDRSLQLRRAAQRQDGAGTAND